MASTFKLTIVTPEKEFYNGEVTELLTENTMGNLGILANHVPMISVLRPCVSVITDKDGKKLEAFTSTGIMNVSEGVVNLLCDACEWPEEIDVNRAEEAKKRAEMRLLEKDDKVDIKRAEISLMRAVARIRAKSK